jgi:hypothetical protein
LAEEWVISKEEALSPGFLVVWKEPDTMHNGLALLIVYIVDGMVAMIMQMISTAGR